MAEVVPIPGVLDWDFPRSVASVALLVRYGRDHGVDQDELLRDTTLTADLLDDPDAQIDARVELAVVRNLVRALGDTPGLGIDVGRRYRVTTFGIFGFACVSSPTLRDAVAMALRYLELSFTFCIPVVELGRDEIVGRLLIDRVPDDVRRFLVERDTAAMFTVLSDLLGASMPLRTVTFSYPAPPSGDDYSAVFGIAATFDRAVNSFTFDPAIFDLELPQANSQTLAMCQAQCGAMVTRRRARTGIAHEVRERLVQVGGASAGIDEVARSLNTSTRTLRRRLTDAGTSYRALLDEVREALAEQMLSTTPLSVSDVAIRLGYSEASTFIYAFKRWKGTTPAAYQRKRRRAYVGSVG
ncbi:AraC family transcriptional regulator [Antrihabitans sp. YC3-6]|uniref:AraC family transcriptional regulator n=1 Tax=Antrihabitans stalagmiti TaxID=2799499 RepID=A0A934NSD9_9NOCA|nr:AraC family transcriptional regulator [Antrihabitans stalagmiti]MBJ8340614.1 AraC family transcriptional regulator [Antrihabitans stalagmiti]